MTDICSWSWNELRAAQALDPLSRATGETWVVSLYYSHRYDEAIAFAKQWLELYPDSIGIHDVLAESYAQEGLEQVSP